MIIAQMKGGLGNQMFRYALARKLAIVNNTSVALDVQYYTKSKLPNQPSKGRVRQFDLNCFAIPATILDDKKVNRLLYPTFRFLNKNSVKIIIEQSFNYDPSIVQRYDQHIYLQGHWQSPYYFQDIACVLQKDFSFNQSPSAHTQYYIDKMHRENSVALHVRRGDYVKDQKINQKHGTCSVEYYQRAVEFLKKKLTDPALYIFSDDLDWARQNLSFDLPTTFIENDNDSKAHYEDMCLIGHCRHQIIANSSFSWWGAWLNDNPEKIVIAPKKWFRDPSIDDSDLIPDNWNRI